MKTARIVILALLTMLIAIPTLAQPPQTKAWIGVGVELVDGAEARRMGFEAGLRVTQIHDRSPAKEAGLAVGDIILSAGEQTITSIEQMRDLLGALRPGDFLSLGVRRSNGRNEPLLVILGAEADRDDPHYDDEALRELRDRLREMDRERRALQEQLDRRRAELGDSPTPRETTPRPAPEPEQPRPEAVPVRPERTTLRVSVGAGFNSVTLAEAAELGIQGGVRVARVQSSGAAAEAGLLEGDVITHVNADTLKGTGHMRQMLSEKSPGDVLELTVIRDGRTVEVKLRLRPRD